MSQRALVVGAGPAGLSAAVQLTSWCDQVVVIDARARVSLRHTGEHLPPSAVAAVRDLGLSSLINDPRHPDSSGVSSSWGGSEIAEKEYFFTPMGNGKNLIRGIFDDALACAAEERGAELRFDTKLTDLEYERGHYNATCKTTGCGTTDTYDIVVDASGRNAKASRLLGGKLTRADALVGLVGVCRGCPLGDDVGRLYIEAVKDGWWYGVQYPDGQLICTFMTDAATLSQNENGALALWQEYLCATKQLHALAQSGIQPDHVSVFDACTQALDAKPFTGFISVGDAAAAFDPLSSWGITKGLLDGHQGAQAVQLGARAVTSYTAARYDGYRSYRKKRTDMYRMEQRWCHSTFWQSRHRDETIH